MFDAMKFNLEPGFEVIYNIKNLKKEKKTRKYLSIARCDSDSLTSDEEEDATPTKFKQIKISKSTPY